MSLLVDGALYTTITLLLAFAAKSLMRRQSAAIRHCVLAAALVSGALLPVVKPVLPEWRLPVRIEPPAVLELVTSGNVQMTAAPRVTAGETTEAAGRWPGSRNLFTVLAMVWALGTIAALIALGSGFLRLRRLARTARVMSDPRWLAHLTAIREQLGVKSAVTLLEGTDPRFLVVWGVFRPRVLVPALARDWSDDRIRLVLTHELAHVQRGDWIVQCVGELLRAVYWFNPLVWIACARLRQEADHACDDLVLSGGVQGSDYASHLVDVARVLRHQRAWLPAPAIAHITGFERRVQAMLSAHINRRPLSRRTFALTVAACLVLALPIAAITAAQALVSFTGSVIDPSNAVLPNSVVTLTNVETQAKYEVRTNRDGRYEIPGLPPGRYILQSSQLGFETVKMDLVVGAENIQRDLKLELGTLQETITVTHGGPVTPPRVMTPEQKAKLEESLRKRAEQRCPGGAPSGPAIGGNIRVPVKIRDVRPVFPAALASSGVSGKVALQAVLGTDGRIDTVTVKEATNSEFAQAAIDAVRQWEFDATLLNCVPVETRMNVAVSFEQR